MKTIICAFALCAAACTNTSTYKPAMAQVDGEHHVVVRAEAGRLWWAHREWTEPHELCALPKSGAVDNLTVTRTDAGFVVSFDQGGESWSGTFGAQNDDQPKLVARAGAQ